MNVVSGKPDKIFANGNVIVNSPSGVLSGNTGVYDVAPNLITLTGNVVLTKDKNRQTASVLTYNLNTGIAKFGSGGTTVAGQPNSSGGRVRGTFTPPPPSNPKPTP